MSNRHSKTQWAKLKVLQSEMRGHKKSPTRLRFDIVGDIAIIKNAHGKTGLSWAQSILRNNKRVKVVLAQTGSVQGIFRLCKLKVVAGDNRMTTIHRENKCLFHIDLGTMHFSPRLVHERRLIAKSVGFWEAVLNMFGGAGTFSIEIAYKNPSVTVFNIDINPDAIRMCLRNVLANNIRNRVIAVLADAKEAASIVFLNSVDRVLLPLPEKSCEYFSVAVSALKRKGVIQYYDFIQTTKEESPLEKAVVRIKGLINGKNMSVREGRIVKSVGPRRYLVSFELYKGEEREDVS